MSDEPVVSDSGPSAAILEVSAISASYGTYRALFDVTLSVAPRGIVALLGANGAGKSTVARVVSGLVQATQGSVCFAGVDITKMAPHRIARLGLVQVPEGRGIFSSLTVEENLRLSFRHRGSRKETAGALERAFDGFPVLKQRRRQLGGTLSGGEQRILSLAKVLAVPPKLLLVDELSLGLAPSIVDAVYDGLVAIREAGCALLVVEQQIDRALSIADSAVLLAHGSVAWRGPAREATAAMEQLLGNASGMTHPGSTTTPNGSEPAPLNGAMGEGAAGEMSVSSPDPSPRASATSQEVNGGRDLSAKGGEPRGKSPSQNEGTIPLGPRWLSSDPE